jgi:ectoine hydroxylase-related dioxygenase (phytanoyl-CoA dioxygenase family)
VLRNRHLAWLVEFLRFIGRAGRSHPRQTVRSLPRLLLYLFVPRLAPRRAAAPILTSLDADEAARVFLRDGYVVLADGLTKDDAAALRCLVEAKATEIVRLENAGELPGRNPWRDPRRYSFGDYGPCPEWAYLSRNEPVVAVLRRIWEGRDFAAWKAGGDFVLPGGTWQPIHSDLLWNSAGDDVPPTIVVDYYVAEVPADNGPIRFVPGTGRFPPPNRVVERFEPTWMQQSTITGHPGFVVIRDPRGWHGGTPNTSAEPRYMPDVVYALRDAPAAAAAFLKMTAPSAATRIAEFPNGQLAATEVNVARQASSTAS